MSNGSNGSSQPTTPPSDTLDLQMSTMPPSTFFRSSSIGTSLVRQVSTGLRSLNGPVVDWRSTVTVEDRLQQRARIKAAYEQACPTYESLLDAIEATE
jgi:hypothetical protein